MSGAGETLRVFISYARRDAADFADELQAGLEVAGFEAFLDRHDIAGGEDWEARLGGLIESADTVVFVITPTSVASERCQWEVVRAAALSKRVIPVVRIAVEEAQTPDSLRRLNYIFFDEGRSFSRSLGDLAKALRVDLAWIREHTRLSEVARRWDARSRNEVLLLRGPELEASRTWLAEWRAPAPEPTELQRAFMAASEEAEGAIVKRERARQRRTLMRVGAAAIVFALLAMGSGYFWWRAAQSEARMHQAQVEAEEAAAHANQSAQEARRTAARASLFEGLYWLRTANDGGRSGGDQRRQWERAHAAFGSGLNSLGDGDFVEEVSGQSLRELLLYGDRFVLLCVGLGAAAQGASPEGVRAYYSAIEVPSCPGGGARPMRPPRPLDPQEVRR